MSGSSRYPYADAHRRASAEFRGLSTDEQRARMREAGVLGLTPQLGDTVRVLGRLDVWHHGIVVGSDAHGRVHVVHADPRRGVVAELLEAFAKGKRVDMIRRAPHGREYEVAARAMALLGRPYDALALNDEHLVTHAYGAPQPNAMVILGGLLAGIGLVAAAISFLDDHAWDENAARYRDARGRFAAR